ncbi:hypothetical protein EKG37_17460 [Robertmurraya yapensis]|uniref:Type II secretion system protein GspF domain-containing protein n=1 Tax=Bacillus yapensis TaxID=2492960 RepID=A0A431VXX4_9BACI|nr:hypothetical protein [Bacillus yapensis]RTR28091.1 hypothetical protein EKG37_17460 [Bacillus yapensis]TKS94333.1 hypothetical protein FAR12_17460 [Bacillus yapensis]
MGILIYFTQGVQVLFLLSIVILAYKTILLIMETRTSKRYVLKGFLKEEQVQVNKGVREQITFLERMTSFTKYKEHLEGELADARLDVTVTRFIVRRLILTLLMVGAALVLYKISDMNLYLYLAIPLGVLAYILPKRNLKKHKLHFERQMKIELPEYLSAFAVLLQSYNAFDATRRSVEYAGPLLRPFVDHMVTQIELYPSSHKPYQDFAETIGIREAKEFVVALQQIMKVDAAAANQIISSQIKIMDDLQEEAYNEMIEVRPDEVQNYITPMLFPMVAIILTFLFVMIGDAFSKI